MAIALAGALVALPADPGARDEDPYYARQLIESAAILVDTPPAQPHYADLSEARAMLWREVVLTSPTTLASLHYRVLNEDTATGAGGGVVCFGELVFLATLRVTWLMTHDRPASTRTVADLASLPPTIVSAALRSARPIEEFSLAELMETLQTLRTAFVELPFSEDLVDLVEMLEVCAARMVFETATADILDLEPPLVRHCGVDPSDDEFAITGETLRMLWPSFVGFHRRLIETRCLVGENVDSPPPRHADRLRRARAWFIERAASDTCREASVTLRRAFVTMHMRPGDRELHRLQFPQVTTSDAGVVARSLGDTRMSDVNKRAGLSPAVCVREQLSPDGGAETESLELGVCLYDILETWTQGAPGCSWAHHYARVEVLMDVDEVQRTSRDYPLVVQLFNAWQVVFRDRVYWHNSAVASVVHWLEMMESARDGDWKSASPVYRAAMASAVYTDLSRRVIHGRVEAPPPAADASVVHYRHTS